MRFPDLGGRVSSVRRTGVVTGSHLSLPSQPLARGVDSIENIDFLAVQDSSIGDLVTH